MSFKNNFSPENLMIYQRIVMKKLRFFLKKFGESQFPKVLTNVPKILYNIKFLQKSSFLPYNICAMKHIKSCATVPKIQRVKIMSFSQNNLKAVDRNE
jgi:hypothetical protein